MTAVLPYVQVATIHALLVLYPQHVVPVTVPKVVFSVMHPLTVGVQPVCTMIDYKSNVRVVWYRV
jgi:hypothetical protein